MKARAKENNLWILGSWQDLGLFVLSPLWIIPLLWLAEGYFDANVFGAMLLAIGGTGHHLPGFIRAYTDPVLFRRFRTRFILAPAFFLAVYLIFFAFHLDSLKLLLILWGTWHGAMQVNGFLRIYDSKVGSFARVTSWLDRAMCVVWFAGALLYSSRLITIFSYVFNAGVTSISLATFTSLRYLWMGLALTVTVAFLLNTLKQARAGKPVNPVKLIMIASSIALWWFAMTQVRSILVGLLLFEIVHDIQYNVLVWYYNRRRVSQGLAASPIERVLFQPGISRAFLYVVLIFLYGGIADILGYVNIQAPNALQIGVAAVSFWTGLFMVSTFLHFYFDGFIWQVREKDFREGLGIRATTAHREARASEMRTTWLPSGWKWAFFAIPAAILGLSEYSAAKVSLSDQARAVVQLLPGSWQANAIVGTLEKSSGSPEKAMYHIRRAVELNPAYTYGHAMLGDLYSERGESERALDHYRKALALNPDDTDVQYRTGKLLLLAGRVPEAIPHLQVAAKNIHDASLTRAIGTALVQEKQIVEGIRYLRRSVEIAPSKEAFNDLGVALRAEGDLRGAAEYYRKALELDPQYAAAKTNLEQVERARLRAIGDGELIRVAN